MGEVINERFVVIKPLCNRSIFILEFLDLDGIQRLNVQDVLTVVDGRLFIIEGRKRDTFETLTITNFTSHNDPHGGPLGDVDGLDDHGDLVYKGDGTGIVVKDLHIANLLPGHRHVLQQLEHGVGDVPRGLAEGVGSVLHCTEVNSFVIFVSLRGHITVVHDDSAEVLRTHLHLGHVDDGDLCFLFELF